MSSTTNRAVFRCHYRAQLTDLPDRLSGWEEAAKACRTEAAALVRDGRMMAAGLYIFGRQLFLYFEALGAEFGPEAFTRPLDALLSPWPQKENTVRWAKMYPIYWHCEPKDEADWRREPKPLRQRGRIAYLRHDTMFEYVYHHFAIVREGLLRGDKYMSIALHEDVLFSYFEEPRSSVNIRRTDEGESQAIRAWLDADPESHFIPLPGSEGQNFLLLPDVFTVGQD